MYRILLTSTTAFTSRKVLAVSPATGVLIRCPSCGKKVPQMEWCLECHRAPERFVRPRSQVFTMDWEPPSLQLALGQQLVQGTRFSA